MGGRCTVSWLPNFLGWVDFLSYRVSRAWSPAINCAHLAHGSGNNKRNALFTLEPQGYLFCFIPPSLATKYEFLYVEIGLLNITVGQNPLWQLWPSVMPLFKLPVQVTYSKRQRSQHWLTRWGRGAECFAFLNIPHLAIVSQQCCPISFLVRSICLPRTSLTNR